MGTSSAVVILMIMITSYRTGTYINYVTMCKNIIAGTIKSADGRATSGVPGVRCCVECTLKGGGIAIGDGWRMTAESGTTGGLRFDSLAHGWLTDVKWRTRVLFVSYINGHVHNMYFKCSSSFVEVVRLMEDDIQRGMHKGAAPNVQFIDWAVTAAAYRSNEWRVLMMVGYKIDSHYTV